MIAVLMFVVAFIFVLVTIWALVGALLSLATRPYVGKALAVGGAVVYALVAIASGGIVFLALQTALGG